MLLCLICTHTGHLQKQDDHLGARIPCSTFQVGNCLSEGKAFPYLSSCYCTVTPPADTTCALDKVQPILEVLQIQILRDTDPKVVEILFSGSFPISPLIHFDYFILALSSESSLEVCHIPPHIPLPPLKHTQQNANAVSGDRAIVNCSSPFTQLDSFLWIPSRH